MKFAIYFDAALSGGPVDGRVLLMISKSDDPEPRVQVRSGLKSIAVFGVDVSQLGPGEPVFIDESVPGYPHLSLAELAPGEYVVQALLNRYETFRLASGHEVQLPPDQGEGQKWNRKPGNFHSEPVRLTPVSYTHLRAHET